MNFDSREINGLEGREGIKRKTRQNQTNNLRSLLEQERDVDQQILEAEQEEEAAAEAAALTNDDVAEPGGIFFPEIDQILWKRPRAGKLTEWEYLVKYKEYSYLHCEWLEESEVIGESKTGKNKLNRFIKTFEKKQLEGDFDEDAIEDEKFFDPSYVEVDRILQCTELFPVIHPKKANEIKGKWSEQLALIAQKLLNFTKDDVHYGIYFMDPVNPERDNCLNYRKLISNPMDLGTVSNRLYLDYYKNQAHFFNELGLVFKNCRKYNRNPDSDIRILCDTLREAAIILYREWYDVEQKRYEHLLKELNQSTDPEFVKKREDDKKAEQQKQADKRMKLFQKQTIILTKQLMEIQQRMKNAEEEERLSQAKMEIEDPCVEKKRRFSLVDEMKQFSIDFIEQISNNLSLKDIDMKEEHEIKQVMNIFIQANKFLLGFEFSNEEEPEEVPAKTEEITEQDICGGDTGKQDDEQPNAKILREQAKAKLLEGLIASAKNRRKKGPGNDLSIEEIEKFNPGKFSLSWLCDEGVASAQVEQELPLYISQEEANELSLLVESDMLYLVKWRNLSYLESTWEHESLLGNPQKVNDYRMYNRALDKESRQILGQQLLRHQALLEIEVNPKKKQKLGPQGIADLKNKLFFYDVANTRQPYQYTQKTQPIYKGRKLLRYYQVESLNWMIDAWYAKRNVILADEMGLGKTIQSTAFINHLYTFENVRGPFLIIAPLSTLEHWKRSVDEWTSLNSVLYYDHSGQEGRNCCRNYEWLYTDISTKGTVLQSNEIFKFQVIITSNEVFLSDSNNVLINVPFQFIVVDEAHRLKNQNAKILAALKRMPCKRTLLLTGTPIQNNTEELWTLLNYIEPNKFSSLVEFKQDFGELLNKEQVDILQTRIKPYLLRRMKEDVEDSIPPLQETIIDIEMTTLQKTLYRAIYERNKNMLQKNFSTLAMNTSLNNLEMQLRKCCNHPFLIKEIEFEMTHDCKTVEDRFKKLIDTSGKMILLDKLVMKYKAEGKKILIFSQFVYVLHLLEEYLRYRQMRYEKIDGSVKSKERQNSIDRFNDPEKKRDVFLLSTKAGGLGINLTSANIVIIFDSDWNPQNDVQATARAHRIGQKQEVMVYRFITKKTYEAEMFERATKKLGLDQAIFMGGEFKTVLGNKDDSKKLGKNDVENLLKKGILGLLNEDEENKKSCEFFEEDIDQILKNNTRIAKYSVINGSYSFSKGSFISNKADTDLKLDDPNFWAKVLKDQESKTFLALKEFDDKAKILASDMEEQKRFFFKVCEFVNDIISSKLSLIGYNADDEKNVIDILNKIQNNKDFNPKYKDLAMAFSFEVTRPSRRFRKVVMQDLDISTLDTAKLILAKKEGGSASDEGDLFYEGESEAESDDNVVPIVPVAPVEKKTVSKESNSNGSVVVCRKEDLFKKLCYYCDRAKCTFFCQGHCRRNFHAECKTRVENGWINENGMGIDGRVTPTEEHYDEERLKKVMNTSYICKDCENNLAICFVCKKKGSFYPPAVLNKQNKRVQPQIVVKDKEKTEGGEEMASNDEDNNNIEEEQDEVEGQTNSASSKTSDLTKCSTANCNKFYHPDCIKSFSLFKFIDQKNKRFRCPVHYCAKCSVSGDSMAISQCVRCPKAYHLRCFEKSKVLKLSKKLMLCEDHPHNTYKHSNNSNGGANNSHSKQNNSQPSSNSRQQSSQSATSSRARPSPAIAMAIADDIDDVQLKKLKLNNGTPAQTKPITPLATVNTTPLTKDQLQRNKDLKRTRSQEKIIPQQSSLNSFFGKRDGKSRQLASGELEESPLDVLSPLEDEQLDEEFASFANPTPSQQRPKRPTPPPAFPKEREKPQFTYADFNIPSTKEFDYKKYNRDWCRYCGARFSSNFTKGPWGPRTLCTVHYIAWNQKKKLDLRAYKDLPSTPINPDDQTELHFMSRVKQKDESYNPYQMLGEMMIQSDWYAPAMSAEDNSEQKITSIEKVEEEDKDPNDVEMEIVQSSRVNIELEDECNAQNNIIQTDL